jgi:hypothetical protein
MVSKENLKGMGTFKNPASLQEPVFRRYYLPSKIDDR